MGLRLATADIIFILSGDDWYEPHAALDIVSCFMLNPGVDIVCSSGVYHRNAGDNKGVIRRLRTMLVLPFAMPVIHPGCFVRRKVYEEVAQFSASYRVSGDYEFIYRCYRMGVVMLNYDVPIVHVTHGGFSERNKGIARLETRRAVRQHCRIWILGEVAYLLRIIFNK